MRCFLGDAIPFILWPYLVEPLWFQVCSAPGIRNFEYRRESWSDLHGCIIQGHPNFQVCCTLTFCHSSREQSMHAKVWLPPCYKIIVSQLHTSSWLYDAEAETLHTKFLLRQQPQVRFWKSWALEGACKARGRKGTPSCLLLLVWGLFAIAESSPQPHYTRQKQFFPTVESQSRT